MTDGLKLCSMVSLECQITSLLMIIKNYSGEMANLMESYYLCVCGLPFDFRCQCQSLDDADCVAYIFIGLQRTITTACWTNDSHKTKRVSAGHRPARKIFNFLQGSEQLKQLKQWYHVVSASIRRKDVMSSLFNASSQTLQLNSKDWASIRLTKIWGHLP